MHQADAVKIPKRHVLMLGFHDCAMPLLPLLMQGKGNIFLIQDPSDFNGPRSLSYGLHERVPSLESLFRRAFPIPQFSSYSPLGSKSLVAGGAHLAVNMPNSTACAAASNCTILDGTTTNGTYEVTGYNPLAPVPYWHQRMELATICVFNSLSCTCY